MLPMSNAEIMKPRANLSSEWKFQNTKPFLPILRQLNEVFYTIIFRPCPARFLSRSNSLAFPAVINFEMKAIDFSFNSNVLFIHFRYWLDLYLV